MFGYVVAPLEALDEQDQLRYREAYCGLCRRLGRLHGASARFSLTYDMTFLALLLHSLYEPEEASGSGRCLPHPIRERAWSSSSATDYAADMTIALTYFKCLDDWQDERSVVKRGYAAMLRNRFAPVQARWPRQCAAIEEGVQAYSALEKQSAPGGEVCACFGRLLGEVFVWREDEWSATLRAMGAYMGQFICLMDAALDYEKDTRAKRYNALQALSLAPAEARDALMTLMGRATALFERLPLEQDLALLRSILYAGVWQQYNAALQKAEHKENHHGTGSV